ncbi:MAG: bifunctional ADP-heptose synthase [Bacteroidota bacterium]
MSPADLLHACQSSRILVLGDLMLDRYLWGKVERISPEAPVPVVEVYEEESRLGGAANVALNLHSMGATPLLWGIIGSEESGRQLRTLAAENSWPTNGLLQSEDRRTTVKTRVISGSQQMLRVDKEDTFPLTTREQQQLEIGLFAALEQADAIVFQDYDKGLLSPILIQRVLHKAQQLGIPSLVDPKFRQFWAYTGCTLFKPNLKELNEGLSERFDATDIHGLLDGVAQMQERMPHHISLLTLGANGALLAESGAEPIHVPAHPRAVADVSGAGDTVIAMLALGLANQLPALQAAQYANLAGGLVCESVGVVPITPEVWLKAVERELGG